MNITSRILSISTLTLLIGLQSDIALGATTVTPQILTTTLDISITDPCTPAGAPAVKLTGMPPAIVVEKATAKKVTLKIYAVGAISPYLLVLHGNGSVKLPAAALSLPVKLAWHGVNEIVSEGIATVTDDGKGVPKTISLNITKSTCQK
jgi:hypothetical protein